MLSISRFIVYIKQNALLRGIISYAIIAPTGNTIQQTMSGKNLTNYDYKEIMRFAIYGPFYIAPMMYHWYKFSNYMVPGNDLKAILKRAAFEQVTFGPFAVSSFFFIMPLLEGKTVKAAINEVKEKGPSTYRTGTCVWPLVQVINYSFISEKNRILFVSLCSLIWTVFLSYIHHKRLK